MSGFGLSRTRTLTRTSSGPLKITPRSFALSLSKGSAFNLTPTPFALSLSKRFDRLNLNGLQPSCNTSGEARV
jgi:hypothetical protein